MVIIKGHDQYCTWSVQSDPNNFLPDLGEPIMICKDADEAQRIVEAVNQGKVLILDMYREPNG